MPTAASPPGTAATRRRSRVSRTAAAGAIRSEPVHRSQVSRFLARPRWQKEDFNDPLRRALLEMETGKGKFIFIIDATLCGQSALSWFKFWDLPFVTVRNDRCPRCTIEFERRLAAGEGN